MSPDELTDLLREKRFKKLAKGLEAFGARMARPNVRGEAIDIVLNEIEVESLERVRANVQFIIDQNRSEGRLDLADKLESDVYNPLYRLDRLKGKGVVQSEHLEAIVRFILQRFLEYADRDELQLIADEIEPQAELIDGIMRTLMPVIAPGRMRLKAERAKENAGQAADTGEGYELANESDVAALKPTKAKAPPPDIVPADDVEGYELAD